MPDAVVYTCKQCGSSLQVPNNQAKVFCIYCGAQNIIGDERMKVNVQLGGQSRVEPPRTWPASRGR